MFDSRVGCAPWFFLSCSSKLSKEFNCDEFQRDIHYFKLEEAIHSQWNSALLFAVRHGCSDRQHHAAFVQWSHYIYCSGSESLHSLQPEGEVFSCTDCERYVTRTSTAYRATPLSCLTLSLPRVVNFKFPCSLTRNITSHCMKNLAFHSSAVRKGRRLYYLFLTISLIHFSLKCWNNVVLKRQRYLICRDVLQDLNPTQTLYVVAKRVFGTRCIAS